MKKAFLIICTIVAFTATSYSQADSSFHKVSISLFANAINVPLGNKYYGTSYGIGGLGVTYHFSTKCSTELKVAYNKLPMIDSKDLFNNPNIIWDPGPPPPYYGSSYYSFTGGDLNVLAVAALFRYDFYRSKHTHFYVDGGPTLSMLQSSAITGYDVRQQNNPTVYTAQSSYSKSVFGVAINIGGAYYFGKHCNVFAEVGYTGAFIQVGNSSALSIMPVSLGLEYGF